MASRPSTKSEAWALFDQITADAAPGGVHSNPWSRDSGGHLCFEPDYNILEKLLGVPLHLKAGTQSGVPALALDVWLSYELRRAGFKQDQVWPRPTHPRILPATISSLINSLPGNLRRQVEDRIENSLSIPGVTSASANILGKNYLKQVDVIITDWATGPEMLISTKRMDSSYGKNAANRVEESYGDAKNLRLRHPLAALGFVFGLRSDILDKERETADWLFDLLVKLGREDDAYHATCLILIDYADIDAVPETQSELPPAGILEPGPDPQGEAVDMRESPQRSAVAEVIKRLPKVAILKDKTPSELDPGRFLSVMVMRALNATPVNMHVEARRRLGEAKA